MKNVITTLVIGILSFAVAPPPAPAPSKLSQQGEICGGFTKTPYKCGKGLECVNTHGPMIADAPGACHAICKTKNYIYTDIFSASLIKYTINSFLALKVTFFNQIFHIFSKADTSISWQDFTNAISSDIRVGSSHMDVPGHDGKMGFGGACFPKDTAALLRYAQSVGSKFTLLEEAIEVNNKIRSSYSSLDAREKEQGIFFNKKL